jgi:peptidoglycan/LPS O-acetylase OafA/YrhL
VHPADFHEGKAKLNFAQAFDPKRNAFGFLRLALAVLVIVSHSSPLGGFGDEQFVPGLTGARHSLGSLAIGMFFVLSGFLISRSASGPLSVSRFFWHRFLRIFPGYWMCLLVSAFVFAPIACAIEYGSLFDVFRSSANSAQSYAINNAAMFHPRGFSMNSMMAVSSSHIAGLLGHNPTPWTINGSLWTLPIELLCYLGVAVLAALGIIRRARIVVLMLFALLCGIWEFDRVNPEACRHYFSFFGFDLLCTLCLYFLAGCVCFLYREKIPYSKVLLIVSVCLAVLSLLVSALDFLTPIALPYAFLCLGFTLPVGRIDSRGDFSYGTYIYAFPVQQGLALIGVQEAGFVLYLICSLFITAVLAVASCWWIEAPCLRWKNLDVPPALRTYFRRHFQAPTRGTVPDETFVSPRQAQTPAVLAILSSEK